MIIMGINSNDNYKNNLYYIYTSHKITTTQNEVALININKARTLFMLSLRLSTQAISTRYLQL